ncbi:MAG TPA: NAD(P)-binding domain-containing protein [Solirubrobacterales bacterium]|nr:NAD(P)-binding domain-containing protein [Solirubrobacterales bacterium]
MTTNVTVGIIGAGNIGRAIATQMLRGGNEVVIANSRGPETLGDVVEKLGEGARAGTIAEAASCEVVAVAVPWAHIEGAVKGIEWDGRIVIDANNAVVPPDYKPADLGGRVSSEVFAEWVPGARVVKTANILLASVLASDPVLPEGRRVLFVSGDDQEAKDTVGELFTGAGFRTIDVGGLRTGGALHQFPGAPLARSLIATD